MQTDRRRIVSRDERVLLHDISRTTRARLPSTVIFISVTLLCGRGQKVGRVPTPVCAAYSKAAETSSLLLHRRRLRLSDITLCFFFPLFFWCFLSEVRSVGFTPPFRLAWFDPTDKSERFWLYHKSTMWGIQDIEGWVQGVMVWVHTTNTTRDSISSLSDMKLHCSVGLFFPLL